ncbi:hypothetical protein ACN27B_29870 [Micromonospora sp. WMMD754]|uniref:hypothetical protein n=1 Tax=Micromonospora sp. WMMD754 TaxID=3404114 RepID=UPI003BF4AAA5
MVARDLTGYQHLHPTIAPDGTWSVPLRLLRAGAYRVYADFSVLAPGGAATPLVLGVDHHIPGAYAPATLPPPPPQATAGPCTATMAGTTVPVAFAVRRAGGGEVALQRYLGAYGHLVVIRESDLGYVHVHPELNVSVRHPVLPARLRRRRDERCDGCRPISGSFRPAQAVGVRWHRPSCCPRARAGVACGRALVVGRQ